MRGPPPDRQRRDETPARFAGLAPCTQQMGLVGPDSEDFHAKKSVFPEGLRDLQAAQPVGALLGA